MTTETQTELREDELLIEPAEPTQPRTRPRTRRPDPGTTETGPKRLVRSATVSDRFNLLGAGAAAIAVSTLLFFFLTPMTGYVGWIVVSFLGFLLIYALLVSLSGNRQEVSDRILTCLLVSAGVILIFALVFVVAFALLRGLPALAHLNFFTETMKLAGPLDPLSMGGILHAIVGTLIQISIALAITIPLGIATAVFLNEIGGKFARFVRTISDAMTALPSIVAGLFVYAAVIQFITHERSGFAASLAISVMMLPIIIRASDVVLRLVPGNLREASYALGTTRWRTVWHVVLPTARSGLVTAVILGTARGIGETSPVLLTSGVTAVLNFNPFEGPMISLPLQVFDFVKSPEPNMIARGFGTAATLVLLVLLLFLIARAIGGRAPGVLSSRQQRSAAMRSAADASRITLRHMQREAAAHPIEYAVETPVEDAPVAPDPGETKPVADASPETAPEGAPDPPVRRRILPPRLDWGRLRHSLTTGRADPETPVDPDPDPDPDSDSDPQTEERSS
ncbi:phosphate ABC transporter permease PstA [Agromyces seonyuensis]|uniref:Phosphate transport system permease protein PstA n=1 Tax=Agromyces seonyuensis TaxID=2662446 RepID=A0A6I4NTV2_9MICO|nr:phosphate ABC transporter permease PstA [Agromyces seonyuensis]MWB97876.1 phosphate ABC transporter permease PstA [Agromyces seonyuensis]